VNATKLSQEETKKRELDNAAKLEVTGMKKALKDVKAARTPMVAPEPPPRLEPWQVRFQDGGYYIFDHPQQEVRHLQPASAYSSLFTDAERVASLEQALLARIHGRVPHSALVPRIEVLEEFLLFSGPRHGGLPMRLVALEAVADTYLNY
jgi:hypothetical protein